METMYLQVEPLNPQSEEYKFSPQHVVKDGDDTLAKSVLANRFAPILTGATSNNKMYPQGPITSSAALPSFSGNYAANDTWAYITRQLWQDYETNYAPYEEELINQTTYNNPGLAQEEVTKATQAAGTGIDTAYKQSQQFRDRYGAALDPRQERISGRFKDLSKSAAIADAAQRVRMNLNDQNREIAFGLGQQTQINPIYGQGSLNR